LWALCCTVGSTVILFRHPDRASRRASIGAGCLPRQLTQALPAADGGIKSSGMSRQAVIAGVEQASRHAEVDYLEGCNVAIESHRGRLPD
jgi:hypothetical protein